MADDPRDPLAAALAELQQLRAENQRLRGLLGLDARLAADSVDVAEPTLFQNEPVRPAGKVDASSPQAAKLALFRSLLLAARMCTPPAGRTPGRARRVGRRRCEEAGCGRARGLASTYL